MAKINCSKCDTENESTSKYCQTCGEELKSGDSTNNMKENPKTKLTGWWNKQGKNNKILTGFGGCCAGMILFVVLIAILFPVTGLTIEPTEIQIDNQTTEYTLQGKAEPNATVKVTAPLLNLNDEMIAVDSNGNFSYKVSIPINVTETNINITAKSPKKSENGEKVNIQRPLTPLTINPVNISSNGTSLVIQGKSDPNASITLNSKDLNLTDVQLTADEQGNFNKSVNVPINLNDTELEGKANATGKRTNTQKINITRDDPPAAPAPAATTPTPAAPAAPTEPTTVTISQLYGTSITEGTLVKVTGTVIESDGLRLRMENSNGKDIMVEGLGLDAYENDKVTITGTFYGPSTYDTAMGGSRTVPFIENGTIV